MVKYSVGIDISSKDFHVCMSVIDVNQAVKIKATTTFSNNQSGFKNLHAWIKKHHTDKQVPLVIVMEATGVYYEACALSLHQEAYRVSVVLPNKAKKYIQAVGIKTKNDKIDAKGLSRMAAEQSLERWQPLSTYFFTLRAYTRQLQSLQELKTSLGNQLHAAELTMYKVTLVIKQLKKLLKTVEEDIKKLETIIDNHIQSDTEVAAKVEKMCSIKGVGTTTVAVILAETNGFALFENIGQLISYAGYDVVENQSGRRAGKTRISKKGNARIRRILFMPALNMVKYKVIPFFNLFERIYNKQNIKMKGYVAIQKKLLLILYTLWKKDQFFNQQILKTNAEEKLELSSRVGFEEARNK